MAAQISRISANEKHGTDPLGQISPEELTAQAQANAIALEIRKIEGFASFALPSGWHDVQEAASTMPVVYIVPTDKGCACFFLKAGDGQVTIIDIPVTTADFVVAAKEFVESEFGDTPADAGAPLLQLLQWLGARIMMSVKQELRDAGNDDLPFAIIPFGYCSTMPLHAACLERKDPTRLWFLFHPRNVTYAYSARNLVQSQRRRGEMPASPALVINNPKPLPPEFDPLLLSDAEAAVVADHFSTKVLPGFKATSSAVCEALPDARVAHFICHGEVESRIGYSGVLILSNGEELTYQHLRQLPRFSARLVVLSACRSGATAITVEHAINLPGAFLAAGAAAVLGTFWRSEEMSSLLLVQRFYDLWTTGTHSPGQALGDAQAWLMASTADELRASVKPDVLKTPAARRLRDTPGEERVFKHPWYWAGFFLAGA
jgi:CHAT domain-containing protein